MLLLEGALITAAVKLERVLVNLPLRKYPPLSLFDTVKIIIDDQGKKVIRSVHGTCNIFEDKEIIAYYPALRQELLGGCGNPNIGKKEEEVYIYFTQNNKAIIQQQATRGCTAATAAMLIKDRGGKLDFATLQCRNLGLDEDIKQDIQNAGFNPIVTRLESNSLEMLREQLLYGSAIVSIWDPQAGCHSIVVDEVSKDLQRVRLRDPYHGWEISVSAEAFQSRWKVQTVIQIENKVSSQKDHSREKVLKAWSNFWREN